MTSEHTKPNTPSQCVEHKNPEEIGLKRRRPQPHRPRIAQTVKKEHCLHEREDMDIRQNYVIITLFYNSVRQNPTVTLFQGLLDTKQSSSY
jgi:hypothetical protein